MTRRYDGGRQTLERSPATRRTAVGVGLLLAIVGLAQHVAFIRDQYEFGQLNDDGLYVSLARTLSLGRGFRDFSTRGHPAETFVPPGFPALLSPVVRLGGTAALRVEVFACMALVLPLSYLWVKVRTGSRATAAATVALLVGSPLIANYAELIMAEAPYLATLMGALLALQRWERSERALPPSAALCLLLFVVLIYLKSAGLAVLVGLVAWWLVRRQWARAVVSVGVFGVSLAPLVISRLEAGVSVLGSDYGSQLSQFYRGGIIGRLRVSIPTGLRDYVSTATPNTLFGTGSSFIHRPGWMIVGWIVTYSTVPLIIVGFLWWQRRGSRDATLVIVPVYLVETLAYLHVNERRVILIAPLLAAWWVMGVATVGRLAARLATRPLGAQPRRSAALRRTVTAATAVTFAGLALVSMVSHANTDYRGQAAFSLNPRQGWLSLLRTDSGPLASWYSYSSYALTGRVETPAAFSSCEQGVVPALGDRDGLVLSPGQVLPRLSVDGSTQVLLAPWDGAAGDACMQAALNASRSAVRVYSDAEQGVSVYDLLPAHVHNALRDVTPERTGLGLTWSLRACTAHSIGTDGIGDDLPGERRGGDGTATIAVRDRRGGWHDVAALPGGVEPTGAVPGTTAGVPYWSHSLSGGLVTGVRVSWSGPMPVQVSDLRLICDGA